MELHIAIRKLVEDQVKKFLCDQKFINALDDYRAFESNPAEKNVMRILLQDGYIEKLLDCQSWNSRAQNLWWEIERKYCINGEVIKHIIKCLSYGLGYIDEKTLSNNIESVNAVAPNLTFTASDKDLSTEVTDEDLAEAVEDKYGVKYSKDGDRLLEAPDVISREYWIKEGTKVICDYAFGGCESLQNIHIPDSVTSIGDAAFVSCKSFQEIHIPNSVTSIGDNAFEGCESLQNIHIPDNVITIGVNPFIGCDTISLYSNSRHFIVVDNILYNRDMTKLVSFCSNASLFDIPDSVTDIGKSAFSGCRFLQKVHIPDSVTSIGDKAFSWCSSLQDIHIPASVTSIGDNAFASCISLREIHIPDSVTRIGDYTFADCISLQEIYIPDSVTSIGDYAFRGSYSFREVRIPDSVTRIGDYTFLWCGSLREIYIPDSVTSIGITAFGYCDSLQMIHIPIDCRNKFEAMLPEKLHSKLVEDNTAEDILSQNK